MPKKEKREGGDIFGFAFQKTVPSWQKDCAKGCRLFAVYSKVNLFFSTRQPEPGSITSAHVSLLRRTQSCGVD